MIPRMTWPDRLSSPRLAALGLALCALAQLAACNGDGSISLFGDPPPSAAGGNTAAANDLTPEQGRKLLLDIRKNPKRMDKLTAPEKRFLAKTVLADQARRDDGEN